MSGNSSLLVMMPLGRNKKLNKEKLALQNVARAAIETNLEHYPASVTGYLGCFAQHGAL
jgi:hypothetical protein